MWIVQLSILIILTIADSIRDGMIRPKKRAEGKPFHFVKWIEYFLATGYTSYLYIDVNIKNDQRLIALGLTIFFCYHLWKYLYELAREYYDVEQTLE